MGLFWDAWGEVLGAKFWGRRRIPTVNSRRFCPPGPLARVSRLKQFWQFFAFETRNRPKKGQNWLKKLFAAGGAPGPDGPKSSSFYSQNEARGGRRLGPSTRPRASKNRPKLGKIVPPPGIFGQWWENEENAKKKPCEPHMGTTSESGSEFEGAWGGVERSLHYQARTPATDLPQFSRKPQVFICFLDTKTRGRRTSAPPCWGQGGGKKGGVNPSLERDWG